MAPKTSHSVERVQQVGHESGLCADEQSDISENTGSTSRRMRAHRRLQRRGVPTPLYEPSFDTAGAGDAFGLRLYVNDRYGAADVCIESLFHRSFSVSEACNRTPPVTALIGDHACSNPSTFTDTHEVGHDPEYPVAVQC